MTEVKGINLLCDKCSEPMAALKAERINLHKAIVKRMMEMGLCTKPEIIEDFKRWYLMDFFIVETSKALSIIELRQAKDLLNTITKEQAVKMLMLKHDRYEQDRDLLRCSIGQVKKIQAVGKWKMRMSWPGLRSYIEKTLKRQVSLYEFTVSEAHLVIQRLEKWEAKES